MLVHVGFSLSRLIKLKNPWGKAGWIGPWSQGSKEWTTYDKVNQPKPRMWRVPFPACSPAESEGTAQNAA